MFLAVPLLLHLSVLLLQLQSFLKVFLFCCQLTPETILQSFEFGLILCLVLVDRHIFCFHIGQQCHQFLSDIGDQLILLLDGLARRLLTVLQSVQRGGYLLLSDSPPAFPLCIKLYQCFLEGNFPLIGLIALSLQGILNLLFLPHVKAKTALQGTDFHLFLDHFFFHHLALLVRLFLTGSCGLHSLHQTVQVVSRHKKRRHQGVPLV